MTSFGVGKLLSPPLTPGATFLTVALPSPLDSGASEAGGCASSSSTRDMYSTFGGAMHAQSKSYPRKIVSATKVPKTAFHSQRM